MRIGLTGNSQDDRSQGRYISWIHRISPTPEIVMLSSKMNNHSLLDTCDGVVLTGGGDVHPKYYGRPDVLAWVERVDEQRDDFEFKICEKALRAKTPLFGICRGLEVVNVVLGGSLLPDIEKSGGRFKIHLDRQAEERRHPIIVETPSLLSEIVGVQRGEVNTHHHQAADRVGEGLRVVARSDDGVIEAIEWEDPVRKPFLLLVQWHPERMKDFDNPFSRNILERFLSPIDRPAGLRKTN